MLRIHVFPGLGTASQQAGQALTDLQAKLALAVGGVTVQADFDEFDRAASGLSDAMTALADTVRILDAKYAWLLQTLASNDFETRTQAMQAAQDTAESLRPAVQRVRQAHAAMRQAAGKLGADLNRQAAIDLERKAPTSRC